ncbi:MAG TPA: phytanoyl-CoA dioxygenase family protein, partial [Pyrinomonadaceae bacterium]|nr:phytanoyl-CoA dioxygenase family protein [Pyrinomonadaceae bacterium]
QETPAYQLAVNFPLVDVTKENGAIDIVRKTHLLTKEEGLKLIETGMAKIETFPLKIGDVMIRDVRGLHRGTPNLTDEPRPMCVIGYSRRWLFRPEVSIRIPKKTWESLSEKAKQLLRFNPRVESLNEVENSEIYQAFAY